MMRTTAPVYFRNLDKEAKEPPFLFSVGYKFVRAFCAASRALPVKMTTHGGGKGTMTADTLLSACYAHLLTDEDDDAHGLPRRTGAFASLNADELARRMRREGGLKHTEDASGNPRCARGHYLYSRHHPWVTGMERTFCTVCGVETALSAIRFHCTSKACGGAQACLPCAGRFGPELATALRLGGNAPLLSQLGLAVARLTPALRGTHAGQWVCVTPLPAEGVAVVSTPLPLTRSMLLDAGVDGPQVDAVLAAHDEANNTEAYRLSVRMQCARLGRVMEDLRQRLRGLERTLRALDKAARATTPQTPQKRRRRSVLSTMTFGSSAEESEADSSGSSA
jgi:hypothetical protein